MSSHSKFVPLILAGIEEGCFLKEADEIFLKMQAQLLDFVQTYGRQAKGAKAKLDMQVELVCADPDSDVFAVNTKVKEATPGRPVGSSLAISGITQDDQNVLFMKSSGTDDSPMQMKFATQDGRNIDPDTGQVVSDVADVDPLE